MFFSLIGFGTFVRWVSDCSSAQDRYVYVAQETAVPVDQPGAMSMEPQSVDAQRTARGALDDVEAVTMFEMTELAAEEEEEEEEDDREREEEKEGRQRLLPRITVSESL